LPAYNLPLILLNL